MTRIMDARHHPFDVLFGSALGVLVAWAAYRQYFPPVSHAWLHGRAYPIRTWGQPTRRPIEPGAEIAMEPLRQSVNEAAPRDQDTEYQGGNIFHEQNPVSQQQRHGNSAGSQSMGHMPLGRGRDLDWSSEEHVHDDAPMSLPHYAPTEPRGTI